MDATFAASGFNGDLNTWDTGRVTRKVRVSIVCVNEVLLGGTSSLHSRSSDTFARCPNISYIISLSSSYIVKRASSSMNALFARSSFNGNIGSWNTINVLDM